MKKEGSTHQFSNKFEVLVRRVINIGIPNMRKLKKDKKMILREERLKERKKENVRATR